MENIVYMLGAGFSQPLGLPLMGDFLEKAKKIHRQDKTMHPHFSRIIQEIIDTSTAQNYFRYSPMNIEEAFSLLDMTDTLSETHLKEELKRFIIDVIEYYTPAMPSIEEFHVQWLPQLFGPAATLQWFGWFIASLHGLKLRFEERDDYGETRTTLWLDRIRGRDVHYSVISLNYDMVLESICGYINRVAAHSKEPDVAFRSPDIQNPPVEKDFHIPYLAKLHGSVDSDIIPPTFLKGVHQNALPNSWRVAFEELKQASQLRIIGYSLPDTDAYIKVLLQAAIGRQMELDQVDVICFDPDQSVEKKYRNFFKAQSLRFINKKTENYLGLIHQYTQGVPPSPQRSLSITFDKLEKAHELFVKSD